MKSLESIAVKFALDSETDIIDVTTDWDLETVDPLLVVKALRDLADTEERRYLSWLSKQFGTLPGVRIEQSERNRVVRNSVN